ncbi:uncharacterized protein [Rutidosis leptorrhynchoides]|uniref:uncharacterized protein n=1 Tax=Rutidosis leptorrhynchoides TaxID=125765 RepID=UPI003A9974AD
MVWDPTIFKVNQAIEGEFHLTIKGFVEGNNTEIAVVNVYGPHTTAKKIRFWNDLEVLLNFREMSWLLCGDFNDVRSQLERFNPTFNQNWANMFNKFINSTRLIEVLLGEDIVVNAWNLPILGSRPDCVVRNKLTNIRCELKKHSQVLNILEEQILKHSKAATDWESIAESRTLYDDERLLWLREKKQWIAKEKIQTNMWKQKARVKWTLEGVENSKFFFTISLKEEGTKIPSGAFPLMELGLRNHKLSVFKVCYLDFDIGRVTIEDYLVLEGKFSEDEIWEAIKSCGSSKAQGPDGFNMKFYKKLWWLIKGDIVKMFDWF